MRDDSGAGGVVQTAYQVLVATSTEKLARGEADLWDSGRVRSQKSIQIVYGGKALRARDRCHWKVRWLGDGKETPWSESALWTMGLLQADDWQGQWLRVRGAGPPGAPAGGKWIRTPRCLRRDFTAADRPVARRSTRRRWASTKFGSTAGAWRCAADARVDRLRQASAGADLRRDAVGAKGANALAALLGNGWYCGRIECWPIDLCLYGKEPRLRAQLELDFADGRWQIVATDGAWQGSTDGPLRFSGIYEGETYDARMEMDGWDVPDFQPDARWRPALIDRDVKAGALAWHAASRSA